jgi:hypothetical protein
MTSGAMTSGAQAGRQGAYRARRAVNGRTRPDTTGHHRTRRRPAPDQVCAGQRLFVLVAVKDSNLGRRTPTDLQSPAHERQRRRAACYHQSSPRHPTSDHDRAHTKLRLAEVLLGADEDI